jgi:hypothetical protein
MPQSRSLVRFKLFNHGRKVETVIDAPIAARRCY